MTSINVSLYGAPIASELGKKNTSTDITLYSHASSEGIFSFVEPSSYPDKIQSLFFAANMTNCSLVNLTPEFLDYRLGEIIVTLDALGKDKGVFVLNDYLEKDQVQPFLKGTCLENYEFMEKDVPGIKEKLLSFSPNPVDGPTKIIVDHSFDVKSVGSVILGTVLRGSVKVYDKLIALPSEKEVTVKSIQMQDKNFKEAGFNDRVGLSLKGASLADLPRGTILSAGNVTREKEFFVEFEKSPFYKEPFKYGVHHLCLGLQWKNVELREVHRVISEKFLAMEKGDKCVFAKVDKPGKLRVIGKGVVK